MFKKIALFFLLLLVAAGVFLGGRYLLAVLRMRQAQTGNENLALEQPGTTRSLSILPLYEMETAQSGVQGGPGVSYLIRTDTATILFDVGQNLTGTGPSALEYNMQALGVSWQDINLVVVSHNHPDHVGGMDWWRKGSLSAGLNQADWSGKTLYVPVPMSYPGLSPQVASQPVKLAQGVATTGTLPFLQPGIMAVIANPLEYEQVLVINLEGRGIVLITGCGHPGLPAILSRAEALFDAPVIGVVGGLHLGNQDAAALQPQIDLLKTFQPVLVGLSPHDSQAAAIQAFRSAFPQAYREVQVGREILLTSQ